MTIETSIPALVAKSDSLLNSPLAAFDFSNPPTDPVKLANLMIEAVKQYDGLGLSANQLGLPYRVFVMVGEPNYVCFNPRIVDIGEEEDYMKEGCLSYPFVYCKIKRKTAIKVRFVDPYGHTVTTKFAGMTARVFQHELDHMDGIDFLSRATKFHREQAFNKAKIAARRAKKS